MKKRGTGIMWNTYFRIRAKVVTWLLRLLPRNQCVVYAGRGSALDLCRQAARLGHRNILVVTDAFLAGSGLLNGIERVMQEHGVAFTVFDGIEPDPLFEQVEAGVAVLQQAKCDAVLAVGGGSVLDAAKLIALAVNNPGGLDDFDGIQKAKHPGLPLFAAPTTAGTGSETTPASVITESGSKRKVVVADGKLVPHYVALDAELMKTMPPAVTAATGMDALTHAVESWLSSAATDSTRDLAASAVRGVFDYLPRAWRDGDDMEAREAMAIASFEAGLAFGRTSVGYTHAIAHQLGRVCGTPHGAANAMVLPEVLEAYGDAVRAALGELARRIVPDTPGADAPWLIARVRALRSDLEMPLKPEGLAIDDLDDIVKQARHEAGEFYPVPRYLAAGEIRTIVAGLL
jgi:alcohol dehydrogenase class IV